MAMMPKLESRMLYLFLFTLSGFAGLIYESIWSHYLKLMLGHAAYAQLLVLVTFMGGMSVGAWYSAKYSHKTKNLLRIYAIVEGLIGVSALLFHSVFLDSHHFLYQNLLPNIDQAFFIKASLWLTGVLIILPQTILLGATFPLMTGALLRRFQRGNFHHGQSIALLYFVNSFAGAIGILFSGFFLMERLGLPGISTFAGLINCFIALISWHLGRTPESASECFVKPINHYASNKKLWLGLMAIAFFTGFSSFFYEIGWIRMLSLLLGSSTHSFELMLSAFIVGLSLGGLCVYYSIPKITSLTSTLGYIQIVMGLFALFSIPIYNHLFTVMSKMILWIPRSESNYYFFSLFSHGLCFILMLPATFCAGMTLPLLTQLLIQKGYGEKSIGQVYSVNTLGAILGALISLYWVMPLAGLKTVIGVGAGIDILLGFVILIFSLKPLFDSRFIALATLTTICSLRIVLSIPLNPYNMASGVFRAAQPTDPNNAIPKTPVSLLYHRDGRTASVSVLKMYDFLFLRTNGKTDASMALSGLASPDETTQILSAVIPWSLHSNPKSVAVVGIGCGMTSHVLLSIPSIQRVDTLEIEPAMLEGARYFGKRVSHVFQDPRSNIIVEDARTYLATSHKKYEIIISEPSNPWVSGVSSLFTTEFYRIMQNRLEKNGIFVQWLGTYDFSDELMAIVLNSVHQVFPYFTLYTTDGNNLLIIASQNEIPDNFHDPFLIPELKEALHHIHVQNTVDLQKRKIGNQKTVAKFLEQYPGQNSDYFPLLDLKANQARFLKKRVNLAEFAELYP